MVMVSLNDPGSPGSVSPAGGQKVLGQKVLLPLSEGDLGGVSFSFDTEVYLIAMMAKAWKLVLVPEFWWRGLGLGQPQCSVWLDLLKRGRG